MTVSELEDIGASAPHRACTQLNIRGLSDDTISRFILGLDDIPVQMSVEQAAAELNDPFAARLLRAGIFPNTAGEVLHELEQVDPGGPLAQQKFFLVGEGSQLPAEVTEAQRNMRFLVACGIGSQGAEVVLSSFHPDEGMVEVMAWDAIQGGFNFYRTMSDSNAWVFAGNSRHALGSPTRDHGPFESHVNGNILMKELKVPWVHWHSPFAAVPASSLATQGLDAHPWVGRLDFAGAYTLEEQAVRPGITRWSEARATAITAGTAVETPARMLEQLVTTLTVNLISSLTTSASAQSRTVEHVDLPSTFFVDADLFELVGLPGPPRLRVASGTYQQAILDFGVTLDDGQGFTQPGDTHFAFIVPERAFEDVATVRAALNAGLLTRRLIASLLMVDFSNPLFSTRRGALSRHLADVPWPGDGLAYSDAVAQAVLTSPEAGREGSAEFEFAQNWSAGEGFAEVFTERLNEFYSKLEALLASTDGFAQVYQLAESRRTAVKELPIFESRMLFSTSAVAPSSLVMTDSAVIEEVS
ncbi:MAG: hypothetical protein ABIR39_19180 [Nocardioides sp.]|uniref:hypothetical protein n=1 Tax=Nocardioides sp. TaxID=35761 RepID=UPI003266E3E3